MLFLFIVHSTVSQESTKVLKKSATWSTLIWLGRKWHCYGTDLWGSLKLFLFQTGKKPKCFHKAEWSHISCLHTICLYLSASGAVLSKIHLQNIFTLKPVSGHEIKTAIKMFKAALQCRFIWLQEQDLLYILQVLNAFFPWSLTEKCRILDCWKSTYYSSHLDTLQKHLTQANAFQNFFVQKFCFIEKQIALQKHVSIDQPYLESRMGFLLEKSLMPE